MRRWSRDELVGTELVWLLTIDHHGRELRWSSRTAYTVDTDGRNRPYDGGLDAPEVERAIQGPGGEPSLPSLPFEVFQPPGVDLAADAEVGRPLAGCTGELALWVDGSAHEDRRVYLRGVVEEPEYGDTEEPVRFSLSALPWTAETLYPPAEATITETTWPEAGSGALGNCYPVIIGCPGQYETAPASSTTSGSPAYAVQYTGANADTVLVADGRVMATQAVLFYDGVSAGAVAIDTTTDALGRLVSVMDISGLAAGVRTATSYHVGWRTSDGGGIIGPRGGTMSGAGDVLAWAMRTSGREVDEGAFQAVAGPLNAYRVGVCIEEPCDLWEWAVEHLLPLVPAELVFTGDAVAPVLWPYLATTSDAVEHLTEGQGVTRDGAVSYSSLADVANDLRLSWAYRNAANSYLRRTALVAAPDIAADDDAQQASLIAERSVRRYGRRSRETQSQAVYDSATAGAVLGWQAIVYALPWRSVTYTAGQEFGWLDAGDVVTITDAALSWTSRVAIVRAVRWLDEQTIALDLVITELPGRDR